MPSYFFTDANDTKCGPATEEQLQTLARWGIVTPTTLLEMEEGHRGLGEHLPELQFNTIALAPFVQPVGEVMRVAGQEFLNLDVDSFPPDIQQAHQKLGNAMVACGELYIAYAKSCSCEEQVRILNHQGVKISEQFSEASDEYLKAIQMLLEDRSSII